jgi:acetylornithine deacetylase
MNNHEHDLDLDDPTDLTRALIRIDSVNPDLVPGATGEASIAAFTKNWLTTRGFKVHTLEQTPGRPTVVAVAEGTGGGDSIMLNGHIDTVSLASYENDEGLKDRIADGNIYGRGSFDMKSGVAAMMIAAHRVHKNTKGEHRGDIILTLVADEEYASFGTEEVLAAGFTAQGALVCEPMDLNITIAHRGFLWFEIDIIGKAAHGSRPELGIDAIVNAGKFLAELGKHGEDLLESNPHPLLATGSIHASTISGGEELSSYPALCTIGIERRTIPGETREVCTNQLTAILDRLKAEDPNFNYEFRVIFERPTFAVDPTAKIVTTLTQAFTQETKTQPVIRGEAFWTDAALLQSAGIPSVLFGVDGEGAHAAVEWTTIKSLDTVTNVLQSTITEFTRD